MVSTRQKRQLNRRQLDDFDRNIVIGNAASKIQENAIVNEGTYDQGFTVDTCSNYLATNETTVKVKNL